MRYDNSWQHVNIDTLSKRLLKNNSHEMGAKYKKFETIINEILKDPELIEHTWKKLNYLDLQTKRHEYRIATDIVKYLIRNSNIISKRNNLDLHIA